ncbi:MAG TPA: hypothetical protein VK818_22170, partial [Methylomirabilota bacterium]|nr:hypothetical protein [Methylomirabilota bacterium]
MSTDAAMDRPPAEGPVPSAPGGVNTFALTKETLKYGAMRLEFHRTYCNNSEMHAYLGRWIYQNQTPMDLVRPALWAGLVLFFAGLLPATFLDRRRSIAPRYV